MRESKPRVSGSSEKTTSQAHPAQSQGHGHTPQESGVCMALGNKLQCMFNANSDD